MQHSGQTKGGVALPPVDPVLLSAPVDYLHAVHLRKREACKTLGRIANHGRASDAEVECLVDFLSNEVPAHLADEESDLFPMLRKRCMDDDEIERLLDKLSGDHRNAESDTPRVTDILRGAPSGIEPEACAQLLRYADRARRHLMLENAILLPFARLRLTEQDNAALSIKMTQRRRRACETPQACR